MTKKYITTAIPYVNGVPHIGHAVDYCLADVCARYQRLIGNEVRFQVGTDEHGNKIFQKARDLGVPVEKYVADNAEVVFGDAQAEMPPRSLQPTGESDRNA